MSDLVERARAMKVVAGDTQTCVSILVNPDGPALADRIEALEIALRPFASHVGKSGEKVTLSIGKDTWTSTLTTDDFSRASELLRPATLNRSHGADNG